jgi:mono/diheme cytochrome c family protein
MKLPITITAMLLTIVPLTATSQTAPVTGKEIFEQMCAGCHGTRGDGGAGQKSGFVPRVPTLANKEYMNSVPDDYLVLIIQKGGEYMGKMSSMPAWEKRLSEQQIRDVVAHIRTF